jgi:hypothetical protein
MKKTSPSPTSARTLTPTPTPKPTTSASTLSDDQMQALAQSFHDIAFEIAQVRLDAIAAGAKLTDPRIVQLQGNVFSLQNTASSFALQSANLTLDNADQAVAEISVATKTADHALDKLKNIDKAVNIASSVIVLAMAITTKDMGQIANAAKSVITAAGVAV